MLFLIAGLLIAILAVSVFDSVRREVHRVKNDGLVKKSVVAHLVSGESLRGVLLHEHSDRLTFAQAVYITSDGNEIPADGLIHVPRSNVSWLQEVEAK